MVSPGYEDAVYAERIGGFLVVERISEENRLLRFYPGKILLAKVDLASRVDIVYAEDLLKAVPNPVLFQIQKKMVPF